LANKKELMVSQPFKKIIEDILIQNTLLFHNFNFLQLFDRIPATGNIAKIMYTLAF
jgi:hypothetical protein